MPLEVARFFAGLGMRIYDVYGMTETTAAVTACGPSAFRLGTVGRALAGVEVRVAEDGEILARGPVQTPGYFRQEDATRALVDDEGWVHTGDIGVLDDDGFLAVVDRKKEMIITSSGKNIAPSNIENYLKESPVVGHALVFGEGRPYVVAVLTLDAEVAPLVAARLGIEAASLAELAAAPRDPGHGPAGRRRRERPPLPARAGQGVRAAARRVDGGVRGADPDAEAEAARRPPEVRRRARAAVLGERAPRDPVTAPDLQTRSATLRSAEGRRRPGRGSTRSGRDSTRCGPRSCSAPGAAARFDTGHPAHALLTSLRWYGKRFHALDRVDPIVCRGEDGELVANKEAAKGGASLWPVEFRGEVTATMVYDGQPILDHFKRIDADTLMGIMNGKGVLHEGAHYYFVLERE